MKLNITVDIDWIEEDGSIDDEVKSEIINGVKNAISQSCMSNMEAKSKIAIDAAIENASKKIEEKAVSFVDDWLENEVKITDRFGDTKEKGTLKDIIKRTFDDTLNQKVDKNGSFSNGYGSSFTLIEYLTGKRVDEAVSDRMKSFGRDIDLSIEACVNKGIKERVSDKFAQMIVGAAKQDYKEAQALIKKES